MSESVERRYLLVQEAIGHLRIARDLLAVAEAPQSAAKVRRALKSAEGAERHAYGRLLNARPTPTQGANHAV